VLPQVWTEKSHDNISCPVLQWYSCDTVQKTRIWSWRTRLSSKHDDFTHSFEWTYEVSCVHMTHTTIHRQNHLDWCLLHVSITTFSRPLNHITTFLVVETSMSVYLTLKSCDPNTFCLNSCLFYTFHDHPFFFPTAWSRHLVFCLLWINKARAKDKRYIWVSVWRKTTN
jgi:hypothetical protein